jgi:hypothetical protein
MKFSIFAAITTLLAFTIFDSITAAIAVGILIVLEVSLSFDNAVINAKLLGTMDPIWQKRFLTWGMLVAVFGMRVLFPIAIVSIAAGLPLIDVAKLTISDPDAYAKILESTHYMLSSFGGTFLLIVFLEFMFDYEREEKWLRKLETTCSKFGHLEGIVLATVSLIVLIVSMYVPEAHKYEVLAAGVLALVISAALNSATTYLSEMQDSIKSYATKSIVSAGFISFMYLEVLDASFSLDGVLGAFAISKDIMIISFGLGIGALFVRAITLGLVRKGTLNQYVFLEHGAHYAIGALATIMFISLFTHVNEVVAGFIGAFFISLGVYSSIKYNKSNE